MTTSRSAEQEQRLRAAVDSLSHQQAQIIRLRYGLSGYGSYSLCETARIFKVSVGRVRNLERKALDKLAALGYSLKDLRGS